MHIHIDKDDVLPNYIHEVSDLIRSPHPDLEAVLVEVLCVLVWYPSSDLVCLHVDTQAGVWTVLNLKFNSCYQKCSKQACTNS